MENSGDEKVILLTFGTRPEWIKIKPLIKIFRENDYPYKVLFTGQHTTLLPAEAHIEVDISLDVTKGINRLDAIVKSLMDQSTIWIDKPSYVLVQGDTTSAFSLALSAFHRRIPVIHLEAGLRTYDLNNPYPEEFNRQAISRMAHIHFCPTDVSANNLRKEGIEKNVFITGNTVLDNLTEITPVTSNIVPITMHRRENHEIMELWFKEFEKLAHQYAELDFIFPMPPNPKVQQHRTLLNKVRVVDPMNYPKFIELLSKSRLIISDSGGIQEESSFFRKRMIVCRKTTERTEGLGTFFELCEYPGELPSMFKLFLNKDKIDETIDCPFGDGTSAQKIFKILNGEEIV